MEKEHFLAELTVKKPEHLAKCATDLATKRAILPTSTFVERSKKRFGDQFDYSKTEYSGKNRDLILTCRTHGDFTIKPWFHFQSKYGCHRCNDELPREKYGEYLLNKAREKYGDRYDYSSTKYFNTRTPVEIGCPKHGPFLQNLLTHVSKVSIGCPACARDADRLNDDEFLAKCKEVHGDRYDYRKVTYRRLTDQVRIGCRQHGDFIQTAHTHLRGSGCPECASKARFSTRDCFVEAAKKVHGDKYDYEKVVYTGSKVPVEIVCRKHGSFWQRPNTHTSSRNGCQFCQESKGEVAIEKFLTKYGIPFEKQYRIKPYLFRYDFYLPSLNVYIEFNGKQHYIPVEIFGGTPALEDTKRRDELKKDLVTQVGGRLIVVTYLELSEGSVEIQLRNKLKRLYKHWFRIDGQLLVFRKTPDVYLKLGIDVNVRSVDLVKYLAAKYRDFEEII